MTLVLVLFLQSATFNPQSSISNPQSQVPLGDSLLKHGFNNEAAREFRRSLYLSDSGDAVVGLTRLKLGLSLAAGGQLPDAAEELRAAGRLVPNLTEPGQTALAGLYARRGRYYLAQLELSDLLVFTRDSARRTSLNAAIGWLHLQQEDISSAADNFEKADMSEVASSLRSTGREPRRSPFAAAILSTFVPGSGEVYAGRPGTGLLAFVVTAGSLVWAVAAARNDDWVSASVIVSTLFWRFYNGSRTNAAAFADDFNAASRRRRVAGLSRRLAEPEWFKGTDSLLGYKLKPDTVIADSAPGLR